MATETIPIPIPESATVIAVSEAIKALCEVVMKAMEGQTAEQKKIMWDWYIQDVKRWRKFWGIPDPE